MRNLTIAARLLLARHAQKQRDRRSKRKSSGVKVEHKTFARDPDDPFHGVPNHCSFDRIQCIEHMTGNTFPNRK